MNHPKGELELINLACRWPNGSMKNADGCTRKIAFCPDCQFEYRGEGCIFTPTRSNGQAFGRNASAKARRDYAPRRRQEPVSNLTGGKWAPGDILEVIIEHYERSGEWPITTTAFRDNQRLPHSMTVKRHFPGGIAEAVAEAKILREREKEIAERD